MAKKRDYKEEYRRRIESGVKRGLSRSQARGHARVGEQKASAISKPNYDRRLEEGVKSIRKGDSLTKSAQSVGVSPKTLRQYIQKTGVVYKSKNRWQVGNDQRKRELPLYSQGKFQIIKVNNYEDAKKIGQYMDAVKKFLSSNKKSLLDPFRGESITDTNGTRHYFETRPNTLYKLANQGAASFENIYRILF